MLLGGVHVRMKGFQSLGYMIDHYRTIILEYNKSNKYGLLLLETWNIFPKDKENIIEEKFAIEYLLHCQHGFAKDEDMYKPPKRIMIRAFTRHMNFIESIYGDKIDHPISKKEHETCKVYLNLMKDDTWYESLPRVIIKLEGRV